MFIFSLQLRTNDNITKGNPNAVKFNEKLKKNNLQKQRCNKATSRARHFPESKSRFCPESNPTSNPHSFKHAQNSANLSHQTSPNKLLQHNGVSSNSCLKAKEPHLQSFKPTKSESTNQSSRSTFVQLNIDDKSQLIKEENYRIQLAMSTAEAFKQSKTCGKNDKKLELMKKRYYQKAIVIMAVGGLLLATGIVLAVLLFSGIYKKYQIVGPICLAIGLLMMICGLVWVPIIKTKLKRQQQLISQTFSL